MSRQDQVQAGSGHATEDEARTRWFLHAILPHEPALRTWLARRYAAGPEIDDIVQEAYTLLAERERVDDIHSPRAYLFQVAKSLVVRNIRRARIVPIQAVDELGMAGFVDEGAGPEQSAIGREQLRELSRLIEAMPAQTRQAFVMRRVHDLPQREIARRMGLSENTVEKHIARGIRWLGQWLASGGNLPAHVSRYREQEQRRTDDGAGQQRRD